MFRPAAVGSRRVCLSLCSHSGAAFSRSRQVPSRCLASATSRGAPTCGPGATNTNTVHTTPPSSMSKSITPQRQRQPSSSTTTTTGRDTAEAMASATLVESAKRAAAYRAVDEHLSPEYQYVGIGSGSTVVYVVDAIVAKGTDFHRDMLFFPTGSQSKALIRNAGLALCNLPDRPVGRDGAPVTLDVAFDGADEVDSELNCIKGGGACLLQEKGVAMRSRKFIVVADYRKISDRLCTKWIAGIPIEVDPFFATDVLADLHTLGALKPSIRLGIPAKAGECVTDNGNWLIDAPFKPLQLKSDPPIDPAVWPRVWLVADLAAALKGLTGVVETGLFWGMNGDEAEKLQLKRSNPQKPIAAYFGMQDGGVEVRHAV